MKFTLLETMTTAGKIAPTTSLTKKLRKAGNLKHLPIIVGAAVRFREGALTVLHSPAHQRFYLLNHHTGAFERLIEHDDGSLRTADHVEPEQKPVDSDAEQLAA